MVLRSTRNFLSRISKGYVLHSSFSNIGIDKITEEEIKEIDNIGFSKPDVTKTLIDRALKDNSLSKIEVDIESQEFKDEINKRAFVKNIKQKQVFAAGSVPMFNTLQQISIAVARNLQAQIPLSMPLYFGISMSTFVALHMVEYTLSLGKVRNVVKGVKIVSGLPFCVILEMVDKTGTGIVKLFNLPDASLDMQGTIGVRDNLKLIDVLEDMRRWREEDAEEQLKVLRELYQMQRRKVDKS